MKTYKDEFGNTAIIEEVEILAYNGASHKSKGFRLKITSDYDNDFLYHVSVHETMGDALYKLSCYSCGTFKEAA